MKEKQLKELKLTKNIIIPFPNFQPNTIISPTQMNDNFEEIEYAYNNLIDLHNGVISKVEDSLNRSDETIDRVQGVENDLQDSERKRILNENTRITNESARTSSENIRRENENTRIANEVQREQQELERISTYQTHINDEIKREEKHNQMIGTFNEKVGELDEAISSIPTKEELKGEKGDKGDKGEKGEKGDKGDDGTSISIKGSVDNEEMLPASGLPGDGWLIQGELFVWNEEGSNWVNVGNIKGEKGDKGDKGDVGETPSITHLEIKVDEKLNELDEKLSKTENTSYATENGVKEFECKDGYVDNVVIEGETLVNLASTVLSGADRLRVSISYTPNSNTITFINLSKNECILSLDNESGWSRDICLSEGKIAITLNQEFLTVVHALFSNGWTSDDVDTIKKSIIILEGDHTDKPISYFEGLKSVGQGDKIEVLTCNENLFDLDNYLKINNVPYTINEGVYYIPDLKVELFSNGHNPYNDCVTFSCKAKLGTATNFRLTVIYTDGSTSNSNFCASTTDFVLCSVTSNSSKKVQKVSFNWSKGGSVYIKDVMLNKSVLSYEPHQQDKKQILTTLRSLPNGVKDTIEKRGNKYYKIKRCGEVTLNGGESYYDNGTVTNTRRFSLLTDIGRKKIEDGNIYCDKLCVKVNQSYDVDNIHTKTNDSGIGFNISLSKLTTQDLTGFKTWLSSNPVTVVYELATPIIEELPNFNPQTFSDKTTLLLNSGVVQAEASFEVTNSLGSELEVLKSKSSNLEEYVLNSEIHKLSERGIFNPVPYYQNIIYDLNNYMLNGTYNFYGNSSGANGYTTLNVPTGYSGSELWTLFVVGNVQFITSSRYTNDTFVRVYKYDKTWSSWQKITTISTLSLLEQQVSELEIQAMENEV